MIQDIFLVIIGALLVLFVISLFIFALKLSSSRTRLAYLERYINEIIDMRNMYEGMNDRIDSLERKNQTLSAYQKALSSKVHVVGEDA